MNWGGLLLGTTGSTQGSYGYMCMMVHGNPTWSFYWRGLVDAFSPSFRCVVPDHLGCGLSDKPTDYPYQLASHIDNLVSLIDHLDLRDATILGHDWGGAIGMGAALQRPDRFKRYVLFNTGAFPPPYIPWRIRACRMPVFGKVALPEAPSPRHKHVLFDMKTKSSHPILPLLLLLK